MKVYKVVIYFTPTSDPHAPYYFIDKNNIEPYLSPIKIPFPGFSYTIDEEEYTNIDKIPIYPLDGY